MKAKKFRIVMELRTARAIELPKEAISLELDSEAQDDAGPWFEVRVLEIEPQG